IMPPIGWAMGGIDFSNYYIDLTHLSARAMEAAGQTPDPKTLETFSTVKLAQDAGHATLAYGRFINAVINFVIVAFSIFLIGRWINSLKRKQAADPTPPAAPPPQDIVLLTEIRDLLAKR